VGLYRFIIETWQLCQSDAVMWMLEVNMLIEAVTWGQSLYYCFGHSRFPLTHALANSPSLSPSGSWTSLAFSTPWVLQLKNLPGKHRLGPKCLC